MIEILRKLDAIEDKIDTLIERKRITHYPAKTKKKILKLMDEKLYYGKDFISVKEIYALIGVVKNRKNGIIIGEIMRDKFYKSGVKSVRGSAVRGWIKTEEIMI